MVEKKPTPSRRECRGDPLLVGQSTFVFCFRSKGGALQHRLFHDHNDNSKLFPTTSLDPSSGSTTAFFWPPGTRSLEAHIRERTRLDPPRMRSSLLAPTACLICAACVSAQSSSSASASASSGSGNGSSNSASASAGPSGNSSSSAAVTQVVTFSVGRAGPLLGRTLMDGWLDVGQPERHLHDDPTCCGESQSPRRCDATRCNRRSCDTGQRIGLGIDDRAQLDHPPLRSHRDCRLERWGRERAPAGRDGAGLQCVWTADRGVL